MSVTSSPILLTLEDSHKLTFVIHFKLFSPWIPMKWTINLIIFKKNLITKFAPQQRLLMDLDISMRSSDCKYTVHYYGALFKEGDVWLCYEVMSTSLDKFYPIVFKNDFVMTEEFLGNVSRSFRCQTNMNCFDCRLPCAWLVL